MVNGHEVFLQQDTGLPGWLVATSSLIHPKHSPFFLSEMKNRSFECVGCVVCDFRFYIQLQDKRRTKSGSYKQRKWVCHTPPWKTCCQLNLSFLWKVELEVIKMQLTKKSHASAADRQLTLWLCVSSSDGRRGKMDSLIFSKILWVRLTLVGDGVIFRRKENSCDAARRHFNLFMW